MTGSRCPTKVERLEADRLFQEGLKVCIGYPGYPCEQENPQPLENFSLGGRKNSHGIRVYCRDCVSRHNKRNPLTRVWKLSRSHGITPETKIKALERCAYRCTAPWCDNEITVETCHIDHQHDKPGCEHKSDISCHKCRRGPVSQWCNQRAVPFVEANQDRPEMPLAWRNYLTVDWRTWWEETAKDPAEQVAA